jgi:HEAT repeat protein
MLRRLLAAAETKDRSVVPLIREVLDDEISKRYLYGEGSRLTARDLIIELKLRQFTEDLRRVASLSYDSEKSVHQTLDLIAISAALFVLTQLGDEQALTVNRQRLQDDPWVRGTALRNLATLKDWASTDRVAELLLQLTPSGDNLVSIAAALEFLDNSPSTPSNLCAALEGGRRALGSYCHAEPHDPTYCRAMESALTSRGSRRDAAACR